MVTKRAENKIYVKGQRLRVLLLKLITQENSVTIFFKIGFTIN